MELWEDLSSNINSDAYFLGLIILTAENKKKVVVDGQQRIITLTLLAIALYYEAKSRDRIALADRLQSTFLRSIDYETDATDPRVTLSDAKDNSTLQYIIENGQCPEENAADSSVSRRLSRSFAILRKRLKQDLKVDPFKRLGKWAEFITNHVYFAVFVHPEASVAYQVFEVINTRGRALTTADLLKNFVLSQTPPNELEERYQAWQTMAYEFSPEGSANTLVQFIRHSVTARYGYVLPKNLFGFLAGRFEYPGKVPPTPPQLMEMLAEDLPIYRQMMDPSLSGPASQQELDAFSALNALGIIAVRPILLALQNVDQKGEGLERLLKLVARRIVVGNLGTGNVERRLGEAARKICDQQNLGALVDDLADLNPSVEDFIDRLSKRTLSKSTLTFMRRSIIQKTISPESSGTLHFIWPKTNAQWEGFAEQDSYWHSTIGNTFLSELKRRPADATESWATFQAEMFENGCPGELTDELADFSTWSPATIEEFGKKLAELAAEIWF